MNTQKENNMILSLCPNPSIDSYAGLQNFNAGSVNRISFLEEYPGGKGVHVALAIAELSTSSNLLGFWAGETGEWIKRECSIRNVEVNGVSISGSNRKCYTFLSENPEFDHTELLEPGPKIGQKEFKEFISLFESEVSEYEFICMSGSWPTGAPENAYGELISIARKQGKKVILDCTGIQLENALEEGFFGLHLNKHEAKALCGSSDMHSLLKFLGDKVELIALTKGKDGLEFAYKEQIISAKISLSPDQIISTVGSGDCLTAGISYGLDKKLELAEIAAWGAACGSANCLNKDLGMIKKKDVEMMLKQVQVETYGK